MSRFYELYPLTENLLQVVADSEPLNHPQVVDDLKDVDKIFMIR